MQWLWVVGVGVVFTSYLSLTFITLQRQMLTLHLMTTSCLTYSLNSQNPNMEKNIRQDDLIDMYLKLNFIYFTTIDTTSDSFQTLYYLCRDRT